MPTIDATNFRRDFGRYQDEAQREPVKVTSHGRVVGGFLSSRDLDHYERLKLRERQVYVAGISLMTSSKPSNRLSISSRPCDLPCPASWPGDQLRTRRAVSRNQQYI